ncbi:MAG TPA: hypothetical protein VHZ29_06350 [Rhizomicrobium sp.]|jgi:hypothetical protein|nr:hypothetical protein [Rhizomicrobium sp.]
MNEYRRYLADNGPGFAVSALAHGVVLLLILLHFKPIAPAEQEKLHSVLVDIVHLGDETTSPPSKQKAAMPQQEASVRRAPTAHSPVEAVQRNRPKPVDDLDNRLNALSKLRAPETDTQALTGPGQSRAESTGNDAAAGSDAAYALRDFVRAQVMRRWNLDLSLLGERKWIVALRVVMKSNGTIREAEVVDKHRYATDAIFRQIAISAKNAVLLSSPIALPAGSYPAETEMTLNLNPRDAMR